MRGVFSWLKSATTPLDATKSYTLDLSPSHFYKRCRITNITTTFTLGILACYVSHQEYKLILECMPIKVQWTLIGYVLTWYRATL